MPDETSTAGMRLDAADRSRAAEMLIEAERTGVPVSPLTETFPHLTLADAYAIQQEQARRRLGAGARLVGHKVGATNKAIQELFGIDTPDYGHLFDDMLVGGEEPIRLASLIAPMVEPEIAFVLGEELVGPGVSPDDVVAATRAVVACIEVIDSRVKEWRIRLEDTVADNGSSARFIVGSARVPVGRLDLAREAVTFRCNDEVVQTGRGDAVLGNPILAVAWLANALAPFGGSLPRGSYVLSGSMTSAVRAHRGERYEAEFTHLGTVACSFE